MVAITPGKKRAARMLPLQTKAVFSIALLLIAAAATITTLLAMIDVSGGELDHLSNTQRGYDSSSTLLKEARDAASNARLTEVRSRLAVESREDKIPLAYPTQLLANANAKIAERRGWLSAELHSPDGKLYGTLRGVELWHLFQPALQCLWSFEKVPSSVLVHDGGKWLCGLHEVHALRSSSSSNSSIGHYGVGTHYPTPCVVYSIGSRDEFSFERRVRTVAPGCEVHTFDPTVAESGNGRAHYDVYHGNYGLGGTDGPAVVGKRKGGILDLVFGSNTNKPVELKSLSTIMRELGHNYVDYLKVDVEGHEWDVLNRIDWTVTKVGQVLIEFHPARQGSAAAERIVVAWDPTASDMDAIFTKLESAGFYLVSLEPVTFGNLGQVELVFVHRDWRPDGRIRGDDGAKEN